MASKIKIEDNDKPTHKRKMKEEDVPVILEKIFHKVDGDKNNRFNRSEFTQAIRILIDFIGAEIPTQVDV